MEITFLLKPAIIEVYMQPKMLATEAADILGVTVQAVHKQLKTKQLKYSKLRNRVYFEHETALKVFGDYKTECKTVVFVLVKGGVGKSTLCRESGIRATLMGKKVLLIELDHQGNLTKSFNVNAHEYPVLIDLLEDNTLDIKNSIVNILPGLDILPSRYDNSVLDNFIMLKGIPLQKVLNAKIEPLRKEYDLIMIDCPPSLGQAVAAAVLSSDLIVMPTTPCDFSDSGIDITKTEVTKMLKDYDAPLVPMKIILNEFDNRERDSRDTYTNLIKHQEYGDMLFSGYIRKCTEIQKYRRRKSTVFDSTSSTAGREDIDIFTRELLDMNDGKSISSETFEPSETKEAVGF